MRVRERDARWRRRRRRRRRRIRRERWYRLEGAGEWCAESTRTSSKLSAYGAWGA
jgi:hypothetical protein